MSADERTTAKCNRRLRTSKENRRLGTLEGYGCEYTNINTYIDMLIHDSVDVGIDTAWVVGMDTDVVCLWKWM